MYRFSMIHPVCQLPRLYNREFLTLWYGWSRIYPHNLCQSFLCQGAHINVSRCGKRKSLVANSIVEEYPVLVKRGSLSLPPHCRCKPNIPKQATNLTEGTDTQTSLGSSRTSPSNLKTQSQLPNPRPVLHPRYVGQGHSALYAKRSVIKGPTFHGFAIVALSNPSVFTTNNWLL